jgi:hypothetical protein
MKKSYIIIIIGIVIVTSLIIILNQSRNEESTSSVSGPTELIQDENGNFALHVSSQSFAIDPVDIKIYIDDKIAVNQDFYVGTQHTYVSYRFSLSNGQHNIKIESKKGDATFEENFDIIDKHSGVVEYWYYPETYYDPTPKHFTFRFGEDKPLLID